MEELQVNNYKNYRLVYNQNRQGYDLVEATYSHDGLIIDIVFVAPISDTLTDAREVFEGLISDIDNWVDEEIQLKLS